MFGTFKLFLTRHNSNHTHCGIDCTITDFMHISYDMLFIYNMVDLTETEEQMIAIAVRESTSER